jgi:hypothetical protein
MKNITAIVNNITILLILTLMGCGKQTLPPDEFIAWVENSSHGLSVKKEFKDVEFQVLFKPAQYIVAKELANGGIAKQDVPQRLKDLEGMQYFTLRIKATDSDELLSANAVNEEQYNQRLEYFMDAIQSDISLIDGKDTLPCALSHYERTYGLAPYNNFVLAFSKPKTKGNDNITSKIIVFNDKIMGTGKVMLKIESKDLNNVPGISWK